MDENRESGRVSLGLSVVVRVTLRDGVFHEASTHHQLANSLRISDMDLSTTQNQKQQLSRRLDSNKWSWLIVVQERRNHRRTKEGITKFRERTWELFI